MKNTYYLFDEWKSRDDHMIAWLVSDHTIAGLVSDLTIV